MYYRECQDLNGQKAYEFHKLCSCGYCSIRSKHTPGTRNQVTVTTKNKENFKKIEDFLANWTCGSTRREPIKYYDF